MYDVQQQSMRIILITMLFCCLSQISHASIDINWLHDEMKSKVVHHYEKAYRTLKIGIIDTILDYDHTQNAFNEINSTVAYAVASTESVETSYSASLNETEDETTPNISTITFPEDERSTTEEFLKNFESTSEQVLNKYHKLFVYNNSPLKSFIDRINSSTSDVNNNLRLATSECERLNRLVQNEIESLTANISYQEDAIRKIDVHIDQIEISIKSKEQQIASIEQLIKEREVSVRNAERELKDAEERVEDAHLCRGKRFIGGWWRKHVEKPVVDAVKQVIVEPVSRVADEIDIEKTLKHVEKIVLRPAEDIGKEYIIKPVCSVVNMEGIRRAEAAQSLAQSMLNDAQISLIERRFELSTQRHQLSTQQDNRHVVDREREILKNQLSMFRNQQYIVIDLTHKFKNIATHLATILSSSENLFAVVKQLIDLELVIKPLNSLARDMMKNGIMSSFGLEISTEMISKTDEILDRINQKLLKLPLIIDDGESID